MSVTTDAVAFECDRCGHVKVVPREHTTMPAHVSAFVPEGWWLVIGHEEDLGVERPHHAYCSSRCLASAWELLADRASDG